MTASCPAGHASEEPDYCSVCGARIGGMVPPRSTPAAARSSAAICPSCGDVREDPAARYCEVCRYDFVAARPGPPPVTRRSPAPAPPASPRSWELVVSIDPSLDTDPDPESPCPTDAIDVVLPVDRPDLLIGRRDETRAIHPEIPLHDPGASRRHARIVREADGGVALQDLASTNGTSINGREVPPGARVRLGDGDVVTLGRWTRITLRGIP